MATNAVQFIPKEQPVKTTGGKSGGGKFGQALGMAAGGVLGGLAAGAATGGAGTAMGAMGGAAAGGALGSTLGEMISPSRAPTTAMERRVQSSGGPQLVHSEQSEQLKQSLMALKSQPQAVQQEYAAPLMKAYVASIAQDNPKPGQV